MSSTNDQREKGGEQIYFTQIHCPMAKVAVRLECKGHTTIGELLEAAANVLGLEWKRGWLAATAGLQLRSSDVIGPNGKLQTEMDYNELRYGNERDYNPKKHRLHGDLISLSEERGITGCWWQIDESMVAEMQKRGWPTTDFVIVLLCGLTGG